MPAGPLIDPAAAPAPSVAGYVGCHLHSPTPADELRRVVARLSAPRIQRSCVPTMATVAAQELQPRLPLGVASGPGAYVGGIRSAVSVESDHPFGVFDHPEGGVGGGMS